MAEVLRISWLYWDFFGGTDRGVSFRRPLGRHEGLVPRGHFRRLINFQLWQQNKDIHYYGEMYVESSGSSGIMIVP